ncbi:MAG: hypothetical protein M1818_000088 [Claussenomyces sp. TS43310]|nr:MAG: hypothetical protein M1818_000088 [Claussenomyces sp. TS43310]
MSTASEPAPPPPPPVLDSTTLASLGAVALLVGTAYALSRHQLGASTPTRLRLCFVWNAFNAQIHFLLEGSFLWHCFFSFATVSDDGGTGMGPGGSFLNRPDRRYGPAFGDDAAARLWQVYARADRRWAAADPTLVSIELLTVAGAGLLALWVCRCIARRDPRAGFWMVVLATGELYGGFMTFCPEWLTGSVNLDTSNFMHLHSGHFGAWADESAASAARSSRYVYLAFFNLLWVVFPLYEIKVAYDDMTNAFMIRNAVIAQTILKTEKEGRKAE